MSDREGNLSRSPYAFDLLLFKNNGAQTGLSAPGAAPGHSSVLDPHTRDARPSAALTTPCRNTRSLAVPPDPRPPGSQPGAGPTARRDTAQKAELIALTEALERAEEKRVTVYTDSHYAFGTVHVHGAIYRERGFITVEGKEVRNLPEIQRLLIAVQKPQAVAVVHVPGHQSAQTPEATENWREDIAARNAALAPTTLALTLPVPELPCLPPRPEYTLEDKQWIQDHRCPEPNQQGWYRDIEGRLILPEKLGLFLFSNLHPANHLGKKKLLALLESARLWFPHQTAQIQKIVDQCAGCQAMKPSKKGTPTYRLMASGLGSITPTCVKPIIRNRKRLESGLHGGTQTTH
ncbi:uncharacterized protein [Castor canadensis]|uniref:Uncharacterized protein n=1 Tax=Castor canadensis TaxID=51338 RepID=A0AC58MPK0_CASCN